VPIVLGLMPHPRVDDLRVYLGTMVLLIVLGTLGSALHVEANLVGEGVVIVERFIRGAPFLAPLLFSNMGLLGIIAMMAPTEEWG